MERAAGCGCCLGGRSLQQPLNPPAGRAVGATCVTWPQWHRAQRLFERVTELLHPGELITLCLTQPGSAGSH